MAQKLRAVLDTSVLLSEYRRLLVYLAQQGHYTFVWSNYVVWELSRKMTELGWSKDTARRYIDVLSDVAETLLEHGLVIEPAVAREALIAYQKANPYHVRFTVNRLGVLAHARFPEKPFGEKGSVSDVWSNQIERENPTWPAT